jgi:hypothetical protein
MPAQCSLTEFGLITVFAGHCAGWRALAALNHTFGDQVVAPSAVGKRYMFQDACLGRCQDHKDIRAEADAANTKF